MSKKIKNRHPKKKKTSGQQDAPVRERDAQAEREFVEEYHVVCKTHGYELSPRPIPRANLDRNGQPDGSYTTVWNMLIIRTTNDVLLSEEEEEECQKAYYDDLAGLYKDRGYQLAPKPKHVANYDRSGKLDGTYSLAGDIVVIGDGKDDVAEEGDDDDE